MGKMANHCGLNYFMTKPGRCGRFSRRSNLFGAFVCTKHNCCRIGRQIKLVGAEDGVPILRKAVGFVTNLKQSEKSHRILLKKGSGIAFPPPNRFQTFAGSPLIRNTEGLHLSFQGNGRAGYEDRKRRPVRIALANLTRHQARTQRFSSGF